MHHDTPRVLANARLQDGRIVDLEVTDGIVTQQAPAGSLRDDGALDLGSRLVLPAFAEPHAHLDKALLSERFPYAGGDLEASIAAIRAAYEHLDADDLFRRARAAALQALWHGCTALRTHADCGDVIAERGVSALLEVRTALAPVMDILVTALPNPQVTGPDGVVNRRSVERSVELGIDAIGGCPAQDSDPAAAVDYYLDLATRAGLPLDLHVDETLDPSVQSLRHLARRVLESGFPHPVSASHCVSLSTMSDADRADTIALVREAGIFVIALPQTNLVLQGRGGIPGPRGVTPVTMLQRAGVLVAGGGDNWRDPFNPLGRIDPMETASLLVGAAHQSPDDALTLVSENARSVMGCPPAGPDVGLRADLVASPCRDVSELVASADPDRLVIRSGELVAESRVERTIVGGLTIAD